MENIGTHIWCSDSESEVSSAYSTISDLVTALLEKGQFTWKQKWTLLERPLQVKNRNAPHIHGLEYGHVMEDEYKNGLSIARNSEGVFINMFTHWLGRIYCALTIRVRPDDLAFVSGSMHRLAFGVWSLDEEGAVQCLDSLVKHLDSFRWSKGGKRTVVYADLI